MATFETTARAPADRERLLALGAGLVTVSLWASAFVGIRSASHHLSPGALALGRLTIASLALGSIVLWRREPLPGRRDVAAIARRRAFLVRALQHRAERGRAARRRGHRLDARQRRPDHPRRPCGPHPARGLPEAAVRGLRGGARRRGRDRDRDLGPGSRGELGRGSLPRGRRLLRDRRRRPEAGAGACVAADADLARLHVRRRRVPSVRLHARAAASGCARVVDRLDGLPGDRADGDRVPDLGLRARAHDRGADGLDHVPRAADRDRARLALARRDASRARDRGRRDLPRGRRRRAAAAR